MSSTLSLLWAHCNDCTLLKFLKQSVNVDEVDEILT